MPKPDSAEALQRHLDWLYGPNGCYEAKGQPCLCDHAYQSLGHDGGVNMGKGWVRTTTHPECVHHGTVAQAEWDRKRGIKRRGRVTDQ